MEFLIISRSPLLKFSISFEVSNFVEALYLATSFVRASPFPSSSDLLSYKKI